MRRPTGVALGTAVAALVGAPPAEAQDVEAVAGMRGLPLPDAYYTQVRSDSTAYRFSRALFRRVALAGAATDGPVRLPVVLGLFSDSADPPHITREMVQAALFDGPSAHGTLTEAYLEMSRGALDVRGDVFPWVRTSLPLVDVVGASDGLGRDGRVGEYYREVLERIDPGVDFTAYDNDGPDGIANSGDDDGFVDVVTFEYLEVGANCGGPAIWAHRWTLTARLGSAYVTDDAGANGDRIRIDDYITQGVTDCTGLEVQDASVMAHELGHALGLPDYYHWLDRGAGPFGRRWILGCWSLMAAGSWGCGPVTDPPDFFGPTHLTAHSKHELGWVEYRELGEVWSEEVVLEPVQRSGVALRVPLDDEGMEFLIAEYRARSGFDHELPAEGVVMYKYDGAASLAPDPTSGDPYRLTVIEQDADEGLLRTHFEGGDRGGAGDAWGVLGSTGALHAETTPALTLSSGAATVVTVHEVSVHEGSARLVVSTSPQPRLIAPPGPFDLSRAADFIGALRIAGGTMPYAVMGSGPAGLTFEADGDGITVRGTSADATDVFLWVRDASGRTSDPVSLSSAGSSEWAVDLTRLLGPFLEPDETWLSGAEGEYLDVIGNGNGAYDVGDLRSWARGPSSAMR